MKIDWNNPESVVRAVVPDARLEGRLGPRGISMFRVNSAKFPTPTLWFFDPVKAWSSARKHPLVVKWVAEHGPREEAPAQPVSELSLVGGERASGTSKRVMILANHCEWYGKDLGQHEWVAMHGGGKRCIKCKVEVVPKARQGAEEVELPRFWHEIETDAEDYANTDSQFDIYLPSLLRMIREHHLALTEIATLKARIAQMGEGAAMNNEVTKALYEALASIQWGFNFRRCPACAGWMCSENGETDYAHTKSCPVDTALKLYEKQMEKEQANGR